jgi:GNAT superfamily N-acetyltransferase
LFLRQINGLNRRPLPRLETRRNLPSTSAMTPYQALDPFDWPGLLTLIHSAFAGMEGRIDPPSSLHRLTPDAIANQSREGEIWVIGAPPFACVFLTPQPDTLYVGKLAVHPTLQGQGHARRLLDLAAIRAKALGFGGLELQTRVELLENHVVFKRLGFAQIAATCHPGYDKPTSLTFRKTL